MATGYTRFQEGDVLVPKITPTFEAGRAVLIRGLRNGVGAGTTELHVLRAGPLIDPRFLFYLVNTHGFLKLGEAEMYGVAGQQRVPDDFLRDLAVALLPLDEQRRIADFLDAETAQIDKLVALRLRQRDVIRIRQRVHAEGVIRGCSSGEWTRTKYLMRVRPRYGVLVPVFEDDGVPFVRVNDLLDLRGRAGSLARIPAGLSNQYARTITRPGDVLLSVVGTLGRAAVVPEEVVGANIARAVCSIRLRPDVDPSLFVAWIATSEFERQALLATGSDSAQPTLGMEDLSNFSIRWPTDPREQASVARQVREGQQIHTDLVRRTDRQLALLAERRQALITAAVAGQLDVTTAHPVHDRDL
ncbi:restriction endonuclease subunit S [Kitasatospora sp. NPDC059463]|uniref:restriction endonuclease subunit S n=1 Tax=unclassified Kitasatospora TaxID=2633591 RepID=UPI00369EB75E